MNLCPYGWGLRTFIFYKAKGRLPHSEKPRIARQNVAFCQAKDHERAKDCNTGIYANGKSRGRQGE